MLASRVCDASVLVALLGGDQVYGPAARLELRTGIVAAPNLIDLEILQGLRGMWLGAKLSDSELHAASASLQRMPIVRYPLRRLAPRILDLRHNLTVYDASYVALAEALGVELVTLDARMAGAPGLRCAVRVIRP